MQRVLLFVLLCCCAVWSALALPVVHKGYINVDQKLSSGFALHSVYSLTREDEAVRKYEHVTKKNTKAKRAEGALVTRADWVRAYAEMCEQSYPLPSLIVDGYPAETAYRQDVHNNINPAALKNQSFDQQADIFLGDRAGNDEDKQVGVHVLVYTNALYNHTTIVFQGSYSINDAYQDAEWWHDWVIKEQADYSANRWTSLGNSKKDIDRETSAESDMYSIILDIVLRQKYASVLSRLHDTTSNEVNKSELYKMGYFAVAKKIVDEVVPAAKARGDTITFTGHSLGGTLSSLAHMYLLKTTGQVYDTVGFGGIGLQCLAKRIIPDWVDTNFQYPNITNYVDNYDLFPMFDSQPGVVCKIEPDADQREIALKQCAKVMGKGVSLFVSGTVGDDWSVCRIYTHGIYHYMRFTQNLSLFFDDGTSLLGCGFAPVAKCPKYHVSAGYVFLWIFFVLIMIVLFFLLFILVPRIIYVKTCGKPKPIIPVKLRLLLNKCLCCKQWKKLDVEMN